MKSTYLLIPLLFIASSAAAGEAPAPRYGSLQVGQLTAKPERGRPASVPRRESVDGFFAVVPQWNAQMPAKTREIWVVGDAKQAEALKSGDASAAAFGGGTTCFAEASTPSPFRDRGEPPGGEWGASGFVTSRATLSQRDPDAGGGGVQAIHAERLVEKSGGATLEATDAWVDPATRGVRLIARSSLPLTLAGTAAGGVKLYVGRDERSSGKKFVQFVMMMDEKPSEVAILEREAWVTHGDRIIHGACRHMRFGLPIDEAGDAVFHTQVSLPLTDAAPAENLGSTGFVMKERRTRPLSVSVSVSRVSRDPEPVVSVAFSWSGREQRMMVPQPAQR